MRPLKTIHSETIHSDMRQLLFVFTLLLCGGSLFAQADNDVLFTVGDREVTVGEFKYIYAKTNGEAADFSRASLKEYLDLYQRFKLKVSRAYDMGLDTVQNLQRELAGYRRQLADNYLMDRAVTDRLAEELYARRQQDVEISHILVSLKNSTTPTDTLAAYQRIQSIKKGLKPAGFAAAAAQYSDDTYTKEKGGRVGFLAAPFPAGMYALETAAYEAPLNTVVGPVRTKFGYHLVLVNQRRPARGEVEIAHIMTRKPEKGDPAVARAKIERALARLEEGQAFEQVASSLSEDKKTATNGGYIGFFGINKYEKAFEDAAFALTEDEQYTDIVESKVGYHIIRRLGRKQLGTLEEERAPLTEMVKKDPRFDIASEALLADIKRRNNFQENPAVLDEYAAALDGETFFTFQWKPIMGSDTKELFRIGDRSVTVTDFEDYLAKQSRKRASRRRRGGNPAPVAREFYEEFRKDELIAYAESRLEDDYPEFRALMREYEEGILLFEATKLEVWDRAGQDSSGLAQFFADNRDDYRWENRARVTYYTVFPKLADRAEEIRNKAMNTAPESVLLAFTKPGTSDPGLTARTDFYEEGRIPELADLPWKAGVVTKMNRNRQNGRMTFYKIEEVLGSSPKELEEARGYVIADYQDRLENDWVDRLRKRYPVKVKKRVFEKLVRK